MVSTDPPAPRRRPFRQLLRLALAMTWQYRVLTPFWTVLNRIDLWLWGATVEQTPRCSGRLQLRLSGALHIGKRVRINSGPANYVGGERRMAIWVGSKGRAVIGDGCALSNSTIVATDRVEILDDTFIGGGCNIYDTDFHHTTAADRVAKSADVGHAPIRIGPRAFVGGHVTILKGVTIGEGAVVGAGSVVTKDVPAGEIWGGVPARFLRKVDASERIGEMSSARSA